GGGGGSSGPRGNLGDPPVTGGPRVCGCRSLGALPLRDRVRVSSSPLPPLPGRHFLGLKPLETTTVKKEAGTKEDPVAADVINPLVQRQREEIREKLAAAKEKRLLNQKLGKIKTLGEDDPWLDDAAAWIERSRKLQQEKELAEKRVAPRPYSLETSASFQEGVLLVFGQKSGGVLEESEDVLVNVTLVAEEQAQENAELRKKKPPYVPYEDEDPAAATQVRPLLMSPHPPSVSPLPQARYPAGAPPVSPCPPRAEETQGPSSPPALEEDEAEQELQQQLEKGRRLRQLQQLREAGGEKVRSGVGGGKVGSTLGGWRMHWGGLLSLVSPCVCPLCPPQALERAGRPSPPGAPDSEGEENVGWSSVNLAEERQHQDFSASSTTILDEEPIVNRGLAAALLLCQNKGLLETTVQKVARVKAPNKSLPSAVYCIEDKMAIDDKYSRREEYRGFTQDFKEKEGYRPDVKIEYVDETGRKLTPKEAFRQLSHRFHGKGSGKMKTERRMKKLDEEALLKKMSSSDTPLGTVALLQEKQKAQKTPYIVLSGSGKSMNAWVLLGGTGGGWER
uniref:Spliceosome associated factor 1, recruiter of U4/U6.U5 tri-snRNP n=1 Tax=Buteo japonicus TaxID=224669 RepID=A0A8C0AYL6_9AVES